MRFFATFCVLVIVASVAFGSPAPQSTAVEQFTAGISGLLGQFTQSIATVLSGLTDGLGNVIKPFVDLLGNILVPIVTATGAVIFIVIGSIGAVVGVLGLMAAAITQVTLDLITDVLDALSEAGIAIPKAIADLINSVFGNIE